MPGLVGLITTDGAQESANVRNRMLAAMHSEPFYSSGKYGNTDLGLQLGWNCYRGSYSDCLPIESRQGDSVSFFYGEHFGGTSASNGGQHRARELADVIGKAEPSNLRSLNGCFYGISVNLADKEIALFTDRFGMQRLYYARVGDAFLFASEAKAILAVCPEARVLDANGLAELLTCDCVLENRTIFRNIFTVPGGVIWRFRDGVLKSKEHYFRAEEWEHQPMLEMPEFEQQVDQTLARILPRYLRSDLPVAVSLTGGLDTRTIMAFVDHQQSRLPCYTFGGMHRESFDVQIARQVAALCGQSHRVIALDHQFLAEFPTQAARTIQISDGCLGACECYELFFNQRARQIADVRLTGNYGSEVLRRMRAFKAEPPNQKIIDPEFWPHIGRAVATFDTISKCRDLTFSAFLQAPWLGYGRLSVEQSQLVMRTPFLDNDLVGLMYAAPENARTGSSLTNALIERHNPELARIPTDRALHRGHQDLVSTIQYLVARVLFKADYYCKSGMPQWLEQLNYLGRPLSWEKFVLGRHRFTFFRGWFRKELAGFVQDLLLDRRSLDRPHVNAALVEPMLRRHLKGDRNYTAEIEKLISIELIYRHLLRPSGLASGREAQPLSSVNGRRPVELQV